MILNLQQLNRAHFHVVGELQSLGFWSRQMEMIDVWLVRFSWDCFGWQNFGTDGGIYIPAVSGVRLSDWILGRPGYALRELLRHEWAHALAHSHYDLVSRPAFIRAFDGDHDGGGAFEYDSEVHISRYAATNPSEDFAENFMNFVKHRGQLPRQWQTPSIAKRWRFIESLRGRMSRC